MVKLRSRGRGNPLPRGFILLLTALLGGPCLGQPNPAPAVEPGIQDNSFLVEEAYNQNFGVVQHISSFTRFWNSKDWNYSFTQEWPIPGDERHQLSYTLVAAHSGGFPGSGFGIGISWWEVETHASRSLLASPSSFPPAIPGRDGAPAVSECRPAFP
jgi:hypothetical protein